MTGAAPYELGVIQKLNVQAWEAARQFTMTCWREIGLEQGLKAQVRCTGSGFRGSLSCRSVPLASLRVPAVGRRGAHSTVSPTRGWP